MTDVTFRTTMRGYDPAEVDRAVAQFRQAVDQARAEAGDRAVELTKLRGHLSEVEAQLTSRADELATLQSEHAHAAPPSFSELGERVGQILALAEAEAGDLVAKAKTEAARLTKETQATADQVRTSAEKYAQEVQSKADAEAVRLVEGARRQSDEILDHADREATARREEAEAVYEHQRARAAAAAADFEKTLAARRDKASSDFAEQMGANEAAIARAEERQVAIEAEAERTRGEAQTEAAAILKAAQDEAASTVSAAKSAAEKIRRESERELLAATSRRDAITAQLTNVRQMLATLGGATIVNPLGDFDDPHDAPVTPPAVEEAVEEAVETVDEAIEELTDEAGAPDEVAADLADADPRATSKQRA